MVCPIPRSGKLGFVGDYTADTLTRYSRVRNWSLDEANTPESRIYSGTRFGTQLKDGVINRTGRFEGFGGIPPLFVGDTFDFIGYTSPTSGVPCTEGPAFVLPAIVNGLTIIWNWTAEARGITWAIDFSSKGDIEELPTFDDPCDDVPFCDGDICDLEIIVKDPCNADAVVEYCNIVTATLNFTSALIEYSNSSTNCTVQREAGNLNWSMQVVNQNLARILTMNADYRLELEVSATQKWILEWGRYLGFTGASVNMETGEIISKTDNFGMQAVNCCAPGTPELGSIVDPDGVTVWPYATPA